MWNHRHHHQQLLLSILALMKIFKFFFVWIFFVYTFTVSSQNAVIYATASAYILSGKRIFIFFCRWKTEINFTSQSSIFHARLECVRSYKNWPFLPRRNRGLKKLFFQVFENFFFVWTILFILCNINTSRKLWPNRKTKKEKKRIFLVCVFECVVEKKNFLHVKPQKSDRGVRLTFFSRVVFCLWVNVKCSSFHFWQLMWIFCRGAI